MELPTGAISRLTKSTEFFQITVLVTPILAIVVSVAVAIFITWPKFSEVLRLVESNRELVIRVQALEEKAVKLENLAQDQEKLNRELVASEQLLPSNKAVFTLLRQVENAAATSGVLIGRTEIAPGSISDNQASSGQSPLTGTAGDVAPKLVLKADLTSDYRSFLAFLTNILSLARVVSIGDLSLAASTSGEQATQVRTAMAINAYWQPLPGELASVETPIDDLTSTEEALLSKVSLTGSIGEAPAAPVTIPAVPIGKVDLFAPF